MPARGEPSASMAEPEMVDEPTSDQITSKGGISGSISTFPSVSADSFESMTPIESFGTPSPLRPPPALENGMRRLGTSSEPVSGGLPPGKRSQVRGGNPRTSNVSASRFQAKPTPEEPALYMILDI
ncbi:MAG: hypothetical protein BWY66_01918 [bacterium ADurb.Bin374]|nr:MAG: hypothetical protein BWY66_01918 [bacterium ADurb.Bin374]